ncbi:B3 domain-containing protein REM16 [Bienertia sinuspersici]
MIPKKFSENARGKLKETVTLKGPSGTATWQVKLKASDDGLFLKDGWREFLNAFNVEKDDILIFKYTGNSCFHVLIIDRQSLCEKESSYFIRKCGHSELEEFTQENSHENIVSTPLKKHKGEEQVTLVAGADVSESKAPSADMSELKAPYADFGAATERPRTRSWGWEPVKLPAVAEKQKPAKKEPSLDYLTYVSKRRPVTEEEKQKALQMARKELTEGSFLVVLRPSHVYKKFFLTLPAEWIARNLMIYERQEVHLRANEKTWMTRLVFSSKRRGGLSFGWKEFSLENFLEESDVLVFSLANQKHEPVLLNVSIFRVVPETVKSIRVPPTSIKN